MVTHMHNEFRKAANEVQVGDTVIERDGSLLDVIAVTRHGRKVVLGLRSLGPSGPVVANLSPKAMVRCFQYER